ncbi:MAG: hypothetical protein KA716_31940 [Gloeotrichia echinulata DEX184]|nr:hypothetical protein [Gloeotrichia echinulata DEX184]MCM0594548.1 hypothetical protein [Gloeotrichia echinulata DEX184]
MNDQYIERQKKNYEQGKCLTAKNSALYRLGTYLELLPCDGNANLTEDQRQIVLNALPKGDA